MNYRILFTFVFIALAVQSCADSSKPNYQYFPNMYEPIGYETYGDYDAFNNGIEAQIPVEGSIPRGWVPYGYPNTNEGYEDAKANLISPLQTTADNISNGKELYLIYGAV